MSHTYEITDLCTPCRLQLTEVTGLQNSRLPDNLRQHPIHIMVDGDTSLVTLTAIMPLTIYDTYAPDEHNHTGHTDEDDGLEYRFTATIPTPCLDTILDWHTRYVDDLRRDAATSQQTTTLNPPAPPRQRLITRLRNHLKEPTR